jgi:hypothetical protein
MVSVLLVFLVPFSEWVTSGERYWVTLAKHPSVGQDRQRSPGNGGISGPLGNDKSASCRPY